MFKIEKENLHHAYLASLRKNEKEVFFAFLTELGFETKNSPDFLQKDTKTFYIEDAREITLFQSERPSFGERKLVVIFTEYFSHDAQHALLKIIEEPKSGVHFFILIPEIGTLLPTLRSRLILLEREEAREENEEMAKLAKKFLESEKEDRQKIVLVLIKKFEKEEDSIMLKGETLHFLEEVEREVSKREDKGRFDLPLLWRVKDYIHDQGASVKNLLETLALTF